VTELRWGLLLLGLVALIATYVYTRHKTALKRKIVTIRRRQEPLLARSSMPDEQQPESPPEPDVNLGTDPSKVITVRMMSRDASGFNAEQLILALRDAGLRHGQFGIFHRIQDEDSGLPEFSVASLVEPGSFDLTRVKNDFYPGVSIFMSLPGPREGVEIFDEMLETSRALARKMDGDLCDEHGSTLSVQRERYIREEVIQFEHQGLRS